MSLSPRPFPAQPADLLRPFDSSEALWRLSWTTEHGTVPLILPRRPGGPILVPVADGSARWASLLVEALDQAASARRHLVTVGDGTLELRVELPEGIAWPDALPSMLIGGVDGSRTIAPSGADSLSAQNLSARVAASIGLEAAAWLTDFPRQRREAAVDERRWHESLRRADLRLATLERWQRGCRWLATGGLILAFAAALMASPSVVVLGAGTFLGAAIAMALAEGSRRQPLAARTADAVDLAACRARLERLDAAARRLTTQAGFGDPWDLAARLAEAPPRILRAPDDALRQIANDLSRLLDVDLEPLQRAGAWAESPPLPGGWPREVQGLAGAQAPVRAITALARLTQRVRRLPIGWPVVLWEPWSSGDPVVRAQRLMALASLLPENPVIAVVSASR